MSDVTIERIVEMDDRIYRIHCEIDPEKFDSEAALEAAINDIALGKLTMQLTIETLLGHKLLSDC